MDEVKLTYDEVIAKYGFKKKDADKVMKRTKPKTEVDGIRILMKEGERRLKLKQSYADRMAKKNEAVNESIAEMAKDSPFRDEGIVPQSEEEFAREYQATQNKNRSYVGGCCDPALPNSTYTEDKPFVAATKAVINKNINSMVTKNREERVKIASGHGLSEHLAALEAEDEERRGTFLGYHPITGKAQYR